MIYVFVFLGEFGVELLNWQGVIRKFKRTLNPDDRIVCCSRASVYPLYEFCDAYIDIGDVPAFQHSRSLAYFAVPPAAASGWDTVAARRFNERLKDELRAIIHLRLLDQDFVSADCDGGPGVENGRPACRYIFSSDYHQLSGLTFGHPRRRLPGMLLATALESLRSILPAQVSPLENAKDLLAAFRRSRDQYNGSHIYGQMNLANNEFVKLQAGATVAGAVSRASGGAIPGSVADCLGWALDEPYILCQTRQRSIVRRSPEPLPWETILALLQQLARDIKIVLLTFNTGRLLDSYSEFTAAPNCYRYACRSFPEQACLIEHAAHCLFFTEGDFGSHIYVPPLMGKDVTVLAAASMYALPTAPIAFWNEHLFRFGGQILPSTTEAVFASPQATEAWRRGILARASS